ncbi:MAG: sigma-70 family RNA polymerase sigma factor [Clostridia bacterium]|nr:sigma-70 family RNA polymerase sigma factor [Clostridia bacterium]
MDIHNEQIALTVTMAQNGNSSAFEQLYAKCYNDVFFICLKILGNPHDAEDITQETFLDAFRNIGTLENPGSFRSWISRIAVNKSINLQKRLNRIIPQDSEMLDQLSDTEDFTASFEDKIIDKNTADAIGKIIQSLPELQKNTLFLFYYQEMSIKEIAELYECPQSTVTSRLIYARKTLRKKIESLTDNTKFPCFAAMPFLPAIFKTQRNSFYVPHTPLSSSAVSNPTASVSPPHTSALMNLSIKAKIAAGITAAAVIGIGVIVGVTAINNNHDIPTESSYVSESETEGELYHDGSNLGEGLYLPEISQNPETDGKEESIILTGYQNTFTSQDSIVTEYNGHLLYNTGYGGIMDITEDAPSPLMVTYNKTSLVSPKTKIDTKLISQHSFFLNQDEVYTLSNNPGTTQTTAIFKTDMSDTSRITSERILDFSDILNVNKIKNKENYRDYFSSLKVLQPANLQSDGEYFYFYPEPLQNVSANYKINSLSSIYNEFSDPTDEENLHEEFYYMLARLKKDGSQVEVLDNIITDGYALKNGYIYYYDNGYTPVISSTAVLPYYDPTRSGIYKIKADGSGEKTLLYALPDNKGMDDSDKIIYNLSIYGNRIYYIDISRSGKGLLYSMKTDGTDHKAVSTRPAYNYTVNGDTLYYTDANRYEEPQNNSYHFIQVLLSSGKEQQLFSFNQTAIDLKFERYNDYIYFSDNDSKHEHYFFVGMVDVTESSEYDIDTSDTVGTCGNRYDLKNKTMERIAAFDEVVDKSEGALNIHQAVSETQYLWRFIEPDSTNTYQILNDNFSLFME